MRDLVLIEQTRGDLVRALFVDRFEVTRADWIEFAASEAGRRVGAGAQTTAGDGSLPVGQVDLALARAFAQWRCARLPTADEWTLACIGDVPVQLPWGVQQDQFPWGSKIDPTRANTSELGIGDVTPVGTFESGRRSGADTPYDLIGNVSEWTETVAPAWCSEELDPTASMRRCHRRVLGTPAVSVWQGPAGLLPPCLAAAAGGPKVPRLVMGADFVTAMTDQAEAVAAGDQRRQTGMRLFVSAGELLRNLAAVQEPMDAAEQTLLRRFLNRGRNRELLAEVWSQVRDDLAGRGPVADLLDAALGR